MTLLLCFTAGAFGALVMFLGLCFLPEIEEFFRKK